MAAAKHTPGRWVAVGWVVEHAREDVADIAGCHPWNSMGQAIPRDDAESCANARLIAASPARPENRPDSDITMLLTDHHACDVMTPSTTHRS